VYPICQEINKLKSNFTVGKPKNIDLAGNIEKEYFLFDSFDYIEKIVGDLIPVYNTHFKHKKIETRYRLSSLWVNFQKKYEFNPIHSHKGILSFVIWLEIPFLIEDELMISPGRLSNGNIAGHFNFHYINSIGEIVGSTIPADKSFEKNVILFPSSMKHSVAPFYSSDDYRISVAGNFVVYQNEI